MTQIGWYLFLVFLTTQIDALPGIVTTVAGGGPPHKGLKTVCNNKEHSKDGIGTEARFNYPWGLAYDHKKKALYVSDCGCLNSPHRTDLIRKIDLETRVVTTIAGSTQGFGDGYGKDAHFMHIAGLSLDPYLDLLYIADSGNHRIRVLYLSNNKVETIAGLPTAGFIDQSTISSQFNNPQSVKVLYDVNTGQRHLYVADTDNHAIRVIHLKTDLSGEVKTVAGGYKGFRDGKRLHARFYHPTDLTIDIVTRHVYIADHYNHAIRRLELSTGMVTTLAGQGFGSEINTLGKPEHVIFYYPEGLDYDPLYKLLYVTEFDNNEIRVVSLNGLVKTLAGKVKGNTDGVGRTAAFNHPSGLTLNKENKMLYVTDQYNHMVREVTAVGSNILYKSIPESSPAPPKPNVNVGYQREFAIRLILCTFSFVFGVFVMRPCATTLLKIRWIRN